MNHRFPRLWNAVFGSKGSSGVLPGWIAAPLRLLYLAVQEFSRNRCAEKASALGFQTVFSLIPIFCMALLLFQLFGDSADLRDRFAKVIFQVLSLEDLPSANQADPPISEPVPESANELETEGQDESETTTAAPPNAVAGPDQQDPTDSAEGPAPEPADTASSEAAARATRASQSLKNIRDNIEQLVDNIYVRFQSGALSVVSLFWLILAAIMLGLTLETSLDEIWGSPVRRGMIRRVSIYWMVLSLGPLLIVLSMVAASEMSTRLQATPIIRDFLVQILGSLIALYLIYHLMPAANVKTAPALIGAFAAAVSWRVAERFFRIYLNTAVGYEQFYGNLYLIPVFLFWVWILWLIVLGGAVLSYTIQNYTRLTAEERRRRGAPFLQPSLVALGLVLHAGKAFVMGKGPVGSDDFARFTSLPDRLWLRLVNLLCDQGLLVRTGPKDDLFIPGRPLEKLKVVDVFNAIEDPIVIPNDDPRYQDFLPLQRFAKKFIDSRDRELATTSIAQLLEEEERVESNA